LRGGAGIAVRAFLVAATSDLTEKWRGGELCNGVWAINIGGVE